MIFVKTKLFLVFLKQKIYNNHFINKQNQMLNFLNINISFLYNEF